MKRSVTRSMAYFLRWNVKILIVLEMLRHVSASVFSSDGPLLSNVSQKVTTLGATAVPTITETSSTVPLQEQISTTVVAVTRHLLLTSTGSSKGVGKTNFTKAVPPLFVPYLPPHSRWGPFFEEGQETVNVTARVGSTAVLDCRIGLLQDKTVTWLHHKQDSIRLLTVGRGAHSRDERIRLRYPNNYRLEIVFVNRRDEGLYECQVATHPPKVKKLFLKVTAPEISIVDESRREVTERYYKAGSALELTCIASQVGGPGENQPIFWRHRDKILTKGISSNNTNETSDTESIYSRLTIEPLQKHHSGNYTCSVGTITSSTVIVHVLNGELPAAVHHGNSGTTPNSRTRCLLLTVLVLLSFR